MGKQINELNPLVESVDDTDLLETEHIKDGNYKSFKVTIGVIKAYLKSYFDTLYGTMTGPGFTTDTAVARWDGDGNLQNSGVFITADGEVGIGTAEPNSKLEIFDNRHIFLRINSTSGTNSHAGIEITNDGGSWQIRSEPNSGTLQLRNSGNGNVPFYINNNAPHNSLFIRNNGNVQIGGTTSDGKLTVQGDGSDILSLRNSGATEVVVVDSIGNVGIGDTNPGAALEVEGSIIYSGQLTDDSDIRLKENLENIQNPLEKLQQLTGYTFNMIDEKSRQYGLIAQDVQEVFPEAVSIVDKENGYIGLDYTQLIAPLVEAIKILDERTRDLK